MRPSPLSRLIIPVALTLVAVSGCGGDVAPGRAPFSSPQRASTDRSGTPTSPETRGHDLLYVSNAYSLYVYTYPRLRRVAKVEHLTPAGLCADASGNVFVTNSLARTILEYAHGGTSPIATLEDPGYLPVGCSIDPRTGNLAVVNAGDRAGISIYLHAQGAPATYTYKDFSFYFCGYDANGNLYADGLAARRRLRLLTLPYGGASFRRIALDREIRWPGGIEWDGKYLALTDQGLNGRNSVLYRFAIAGNKATTIGSARLLSSLDVTQFGIAGNVLIGPDIGREGGNALRLWAYPRGGEPLRNLFEIGAPEGVAISKKA